MNGFDGNLREYIHAMPKVELHVHLQGSVKPSTLLKLAKRNGIALPAETIQELGRWFAFTSFRHFIEIYDLICECFRTPDDLELATREFLVGQAADNVLYTELTYTPSRGRMSFAEQLGAINRARKWAEQNLGVRMNVVIDMVRDAEGRKSQLSVADWAASAMKEGVVALGLGGMEAGNPVDDFADAFDRAYAAGLPAVPHAGEASGPESVWGALRVARAARIGHGVRCLEDPSLVQELRERQIPLEVCPLSNVRLGIFDRIENHPLPRLIEEGLCVTINSDDPGVLGTILTDDYVAVAEAFGFDVEMLKRLNLNGIRAAFLDADSKSRMERELLEWKWHGEVEKDK